MARVVEIPGAGHLAFGCYSEVIIQQIEPFVAGSGIQFTERGSTALKGVPEQWRLYSVDDA